MPPLPGTATLFFWSNQAIGGSIVQAVAEGKPGPKGTPLAETFRRSISTKGAISKSP
jgi:hypothetical protein